MTQLPDEPWRADGAPPRQARTNGLHADAWAPLQDVQPRFTAAILDALRQASVPAYAAPAHGRSGIYFEVQLPRTPTDRLWVDAALRTEATLVVQQILPRLEAELVDDFDAIVAQLGDSFGSDVTVEGAPVVAPKTFDMYDEDEHFIPPDPGPAAPMHPVTRYGWVALLGGVALLVVPTLFAHTLTTGWTLLGIAGIVGGFITLVLRMKDSPPTDSGPDDGAVV
jgi:hypothetical protein